MITLPWIILMNAVTANCWFLDYSEIPEDAVLRTPSLIKKYGYPVEVHHVETADGYILEMHRIPPGKHSGNHKGPKKVVFLQHGLTASSADFVLIGPDKALAYLLVDAGYDVWMGNARGNTYSRRHVKFDPDKDKRDFWNFSWHEIGVFDLPAMIDYVLQKTAQNKLFYIGHSQGTTTFYVMCAERPEYNNKISLMISLAPIAFMGHMRSPIFRTLSRIEGLLGILFDMVGIHELLPRSKFLSAVSIVCNKFPLLEAICKNSLFFVYGFNNKQFNETLLPLIAGHTPAGCNTMQLRHHAQDVISGKFARFKSVWLSRNLQTYGSPNPPEYNLKNIVAPIYLLYSKNDMLSDASDVKLLAQQVPGVIDMVLVNDKEFNHIDYLYAINVTDSLYKPILKLLAKTATNTK